MGPIWVPYGSHMVYMETIWVPYGIHEDHMGPIWVPYGIRGSHMSHMGKTRWVPDGPHGANEIWIPDGVSGPHLGPMFAHLGPIWVAHMVTIW